MALIPKVCGKSNITFPDASCGSIIIDGIEDTTINQGADIDLLEGVTAYDADGNEIPVTVEPSEIPKCEVGEHTVEYKAVGKSNEPLPYLPCGKNAVETSDCQISVETEERVITIEQADPPTISGLSEIDIEAGDTVNLMEGVSAVDDNGNPVEVQFMGGSTNDIAEGDDIVTVETDLEEPLKSLELTLSPHQDCTPWIGTEKNTAPYILRAMPEQSNDYNRESLNSIVGATVAWNQMVDKTNLAGSTHNGVTATVDASNGSVTVTGTATANAQPSMSLPHLTFTKGHVYYMAQPQGASSSTYFTRTGEDTFWSYHIINKAPSDSAVTNLRMFVPNGSTVNVTFKPQCIDLTSAFGIPIADYVYQLEQSTSGSGVAWLKAHFPKMFAQYNEYESGRLESVSGLVSHDLVGRNQFPTIIGGTRNGVTAVTNEDGSVTLNGTAVGAAVFYSDYINVKAGRYIITCGIPTREIVAAYLDGVSGSASEGAILTFNEDKRIRGVIQVYSGKTASNIVMYPMLRSVDDLDDTYEPYVRHSYALDSDLTLRGLLKLDASNNLYADGDTYFPSGSVTRNIKEYTFTGNETWSHYATNSPVWYILDITDAEYTTTAMLASADFTPQTAGGGSAHSGDGEIWVQGTPTYKRLYVCNSSATSSEDMQAYTQGKSFLYKTTTPTTEQADPYTQLQVADPNGTEEFVTDSIVPVGQESTYSLVCPISGHDEVNVDVVGKNLFNKDSAVIGERYNANGTASVANTKARSELIRVEPSTDYYFQNVMAGGDYSAVWWYDKDGNNVGYNSISGSAGTSVSGGFTSPANAYWVGVNILVSSLDSAQVELGSTATDYEPYQGQTITETLVSNVWDEEWELGYFNLNTGIPVSNPSISRSKNFIPVMGDTAYYYKSNGQNHTLLFYDADYGYISYSSYGIASNTFTTPENAQYMKFAFVGTTYNGDIAIYSPPIADGQVYSGTIDLVTGELTVDMVSAIITGTSTSPRFIEVNQSATADGTKYIGYINSVSFGMKTDNIAKADTFAFQDNALQDMHVGEFNARGSYFRFVLPDGITTLNELKNWLNSNPIQLVYQLATLQTYQLDPHVIYAIKNQMNFWSDEADHIKVIFVKSIEEIQQYNVDGLYGVSYMAEDECGNRVWMVRLVNVGDAECEPLEDENGNAIQTEDDEVLCYQAGLPCAVVCESAVCESVVCCD